jgi:1-acyl-sn-glycerol-3-phosphate acyltransferase
MRAGRVLGFAPSPEQRRGGAVYRAEATAGSAGASVSPPAPGTAAVGHRPGSEPGRPPAPACDDFGMDPAYIARYGRTSSASSTTVWWRIEVRGLEHVPREGRAVLTGVHRGFMPYDGVMALHLLVRETGRYPRFLVHPTLFKFPFLFPFMTRLGGVLACRENADRILERRGHGGHLPGGHPRRLHPYRRAYRLGKFGRDEYVRMALRNRAPILPFVTVGSAEIFPILGRIDWGWWKR